MFLPHELMASFYNFRGGELFFSRMAGTPYASRLLLDVQIALWFGRLVSFSDGLPGIARVLGSQRWPCKKIVGWRGTFASCPLKKVFKVKVQPKNATLGAGGPRSYTQSCSIQTIRRRGWCPEPLISTQSYVSSVTFMYKSTFFCLFASKMYTWGLQNFELFSLICPLCTTVYDSRIVFPACAQIGKLLWCHCWGWIWKMPTFISYCTWGFLSDLLYTQTPLAGILSWNGFVGRWEFVVPCMEQIVSE